MRLLSKLLQYSSKGQMPSPASRKGIRLFKPIVADFFILRNPGEKNIVSKMVLDYNKGRFTHAQIPVTIHYYFMLLKGVAVMKHKLRNAIILTSVCVGSLHIINQLISTAATVKNLLPVRPGKYFRLETWKGLLSENSVPENHFF